VSNKYDLMPKKSKTSSMEIWQTKSKRKLIMKVKGRAIVKRRRSPTKIRSKVPC